MLVLIQCRPPDASSRRKPGSITVHVTTPWIPAFAGMRLHATWNLFNFFKINTENEKLNCHQETASSSTKAGKVMVTCAPFPLGLLTEMRPPQSLMICLQMVKPRPVPP